MLKRSIVILTGAGISAESGLDTFRDAGGVWSRVNLEDVATPEGFERDPGLVHAFYNARRIGMKRVAPNAAHHALARLEREFPGDFLLVTQNIDDLHARAGSRAPVHMHGQIGRMSCTECGERSDAPDVLGVLDVCGWCGTRGTLRPDIVWFGEYPYHLDRIVAALDQCDTFVAIGTSGTVYPAAGFVELARNGGAHTVELNLKCSAPTAGFAEQHEGPATEVVPAFVEQLLASTRV